MGTIPKYLSIGSRIQQIRRRFGLSQKKFAENIGLSNQMLSVLEKGLSKPTIPVLLAIEYRYKFRLEWILTGNEPIYVDALNPPQIIPMMGKETSQKQLMFWINKLIRVFDNGDKEKIEAIKAQLRVLDPGKKTEAQEEPERAAG